MAASPTTESELEQTARRVAEGRRIAAEQRERVAVRHFRGLDTTGAQSLLAQFERTPAIFETDLARLKSNRWRA